MTCAQCFQTQCSTAAKLLLPGSGMHGYLVGSSCGYIGIHQALLQHAQRYGGGCYAGLLLPKLRTESSRNLLQVVGHLAADCNNDYTNMLMRLALCCCYEQAHSATCCGRRRACRAVHTLTGLDHSKHDVVSACMQYPRGSRPVPGVTPGECLCDQSRLPSLYQANKSTKLVYLTRASLLLLLLWYR